MRAGQVSTVVHFENSYASGQKKRPRGPRPTPTVEITGNLDAVLQPPLGDLKTQAIAYYLHDHLRTLKDAPSILKGNLDDFLPIWRSRADYPILDLAVSSMALAVFSRTQQHGPAAIEASMEYNRLLRMAQVTIPSLDHGNIDACLLAIFFMGRYEDVVYRPHHRRMKAPLVTTCQSISHHDGALAILKVWKDHLSHSQSATNIIKHTRRGVIRSALMRNLALPEWLVQGSCFGEHGAELDFDSIVVQVVNIRQRLCTFLRETETGPWHSPCEITSIADELNKELQDLDKALQVWTSHFPSTWSLQRHMLPKSHPWPMRDFHSPIVYSYSSGAFAAVWNQYYATRMLINSTRLRVLDLGYPDSDIILPCEQRLECLSYMKTMANDLASSLPFCLQRFKVTDCPDSSSSSPRNTIILNTNEEIKPYLAALTVWPLTIVSGLDDVHVEQTSWFRSELARVGRVIGAGVLECAETDQWLRL